MSLALQVEELRRRPWQPRPLDAPIPIDALPTPALLLHGPAFERNLARMSDHLRAAGKGLRPHAKTHKCPRIAAAQLHRGAVGICAAKVSEAVALASAGIDRILLTSPVVDAPRAALLAELAGEIRLDVVVDSPRGLAVLAEAADPHGRLGVLLDVDVAMGRTGLRGLEAQLELAGQLAETPGLEFLGIQHYAGHLMHLPSFEERRRRSLAAWGELQGLLQSLAARGLAATVVTGGGTGSYEIDPSVAALTDLQAGSYIFMDEEYRRIEASDHGSLDDFEVALTVASTVISQPRAGMVTVDAGYKAFASDSVAPVPLEAPDTRYRFAGDEHGVLIPPPGSPPPALGSVQQFVTPHCDPTVNLYDGYWVHDGEQVTEWWPISARGCSW